MNRFTTTMMISALGLGSQLANAAPPKGPPTVIVRFADLDLSHNQGVTALYQRLIGRCRSSAGLLLRSSTPINVVGEQYIASCHAMAHSPSGAVWMFQE